MCKQIICCTTISTHTHRVISTVVRRNIQSQSILPTSKHQHNTMIVLLHATRNQPTKHHTNTHKLTVLSIKHPNNLFHSCILFLHFNYRVPLDAAAGIVLFTPTLLLLTLLVTV